MTAEAVLKSSRHSKSGRQRQTLESAIALCVVISFLILPLFAWIGLLGLYSAWTAKSSKLIIGLAIFMFSFLIAGRHLGYLWGKSDDLPSYLLAYEAFSGFMSVIPLTVFYAKNGDIGFAYFSYGISLVTEKHRFLYFFITVAVSLIAYVKFAERYTKGIYVLFALVCYITFFKAFQIQWMIIRSCLAIPILFLALDYVSENRRRLGYSLFVLGFLLHGATAVLFFPALLYGRRLSKSINLKELSKYLIYFSVIGGVLGFVLAMTSSYVLNKIMSQSIEINAENAIVYLVPLAIGVTYCIQARNRFLKNVTLYFLVIGFIGFFFGKNFGRFVHPLLFLLPIIVIHLTQELEQRSRLISVLRPTYQVLCFLSFLYVIQLDQPNFYYKDENINPANVTGYRQFLLFGEYVEDDVIYYRGWRDKPLTTDN